MEIPRSENPLLDATGKNGHIGQNDDDVWFLAGTLNTDRVTRFLKIPSHVKAYFFPAITFELSTLEVEVKDLQELVPVVRNAVDGVVHKEVYVDGNYPPVFRAGSDIINFTAPRDNILRDVYGEVVKAEQAQAISDGYWVLVKKLGTGRQVIRIAGELIYGEYLYKTNVTYELEVA